MRGETFNECYSEKEGKCVLYSCGRDVASMHFFILVILYIKCTEYQRLLPLCPSIPPSFLRHERTQGKFHTPWQCNDEMISQRRILWHHSVNLPQTSQPPHTLPLDE